MYNDSCYEPQPAGRANWCFEWLLSNDFKYPFASRSIGKICLLPTTGIPHTLHQQYHYRRGHFIQHAKTLTPTQLAYEGMFEYDDIHEQLIYPNNTLIKQNGRLKKSIYVVLDDGKAHLFPDFDTFTNMQYDIADILVVNDEEFQRIGVGNTIPSTSTR